MLIETEEIKQMEHQLDKLVQTARTAIVVGSQKAKKARKHLLETLNGGKLDRAVMTEKELLKLYYEIDKLESDLTFKLLDEMEASNK